MKNLKLFEPLVNAELPRIVYCGNDLNLPGMGEQVHIFCRTSSAGRQHTTKAVGYWLEEQGKTTWYVGEVKVKVPVVAWIYIPDNYRLSNEKLFQLSRLGDMPL